LSPDKEIKRGGGNMPDVNKKMHELITYFADEFILDILSDTTERSPTFMLLPFRKYDNNTLPQSWAFVKNLHVPTPEVWYR
jgi:N-acetylmuramic acid 6-phosphate etherase